MRYGEGRWVDIEELDKEKVVVVCPLAALEQHGHHLPLLTDTFLVTEVAERAEKANSENILLTPTMWLGSSDHHLDFPGTISIPATLYIDVVKNIIRCFVKAGFGRILFLNGHGGNVAPGQVAITEMVNSCDEAEAVSIAFASYWTLAGDAFSPEKHGMQSPQVTHACEFETSMMLVVRKELVHLNAVKSHPPVIESKFFHSEQGGRVSVANRFRRLTATGAMGKPEHAPAEKGESLLAAAAKEVCSFVDEFLGWPQRPVLKD